MKARLLIIAGPTGAGKSRLAELLAREVGGGVLSADSQQVYRGMDLGTGKVDKKTRARVPHYLIDVVEPDEEMTAARFAAEADRVIAEQRALGRPIIVAGGTGLYLRALLLGFFPGPPANPRLRNSMNKVELMELGRRLARIDPVMAERIGRNDRKRLTRALEVYALTGVLMSEHQKYHSHKEVEPRYLARIVCLAPERRKLYQSIDARVDKMIGKGLVDEVVDLRARGYRPPLRSQQAIGYAEIHKYLDGELELAEAVQLIKRNSRRYAKRQLSWLRNGPPSEVVEWYDEDLGAVDLSSWKRYLVDEPDI